MSAPRVLVVEHQRDASLGHFAAELAEAGVEPVVVGPDTGSPVPESLDGFDALLVLGGSMGPLDDEEAAWLPATRSLLQASVARELPTLGICLGAQLLATATGGHVRTMPDGPEVGLLRLQFSASAADDPVFADLADRCVRAVQWHWLEVEKLPEGAQVIASSEACAHQVFRIGNAAWGVQFHPEALGRTAQDWADEDPKSLEVLGIEPRALVEEIRATEPVLRETWSQIARRFGALAMERSS
ncbi:type 1 glutamine amidotransferase [Leucobacter sp. USHLN153]|uniref:type 1 glutamine amidotransferase n=1 Tax=Leucobacter sp. USHLN153 TaxID=3081268 RepID=UPI0030198E8B